MLECDYEVKQIDGDYAHLQRIDRPEEELKLVARALLPMVTMPTWNVRTLRRMNRNWWPVHCFLQRFMRDVSFIMR